MLGYVIGAHSGRGLRGCVFLSKIVNAIQI